MVIGVAVFGVMFYSIFKFRKSRVLSLNIGMKTPPLKCLDRHPIYHFDRDGRASDRHFNGHVRHVRSRCRYPDHWLSVEVDKSVFDEDIDFFEFIDSSGRDQQRVSKNPNYLLEVDNALVIPANKKVRFGYS